MNAMPPAAAAIRRPVPPSKAVQSDAALQLRAERSEALGDILLRFQHHASMVHTYATTIQVAPDVARAFATAILEQCEALEVANG